MPLLRRLHDIAEGPPSAEAVCYYSPQEASRLLAELERMRSVVQGWEDYWEHHLQHDFIDRVATAAATGRGLLAAFW